MGFHVVWLAARDVAPEALAQRTAFKRTGQAEEEYDEGWWTFRVQDWSVIVGMGWDYWDHLLEVDCEDLEAPVVRVVIDEMNMYSSVEYFGPDDELWEVTYEGNQGPSEPEPAGELPPMYEVFLAEMRAAQAADDGTVDHMFEVAPLMAHALVGFRLEQPLPNLEYWELTPDPSARRPGAFKYAGEDPPGFPGKPVDGKAARKAEAYAPPPKDSKPSGPADKAAGQNPLSESEAGQDITDGSRRVRWWTKLFGRPRP